MTNEELRQRIEQYSHRADLREEGLIDHFIELAAVRIGRDCRMIEQERSATLTVTDSIGLPADYAEMRAVKKNGGARAITLNYKTPQQFHLQNQADDNYTIHNGQLKINGEAEITLDYFVRPAELETDAATNFVLLTHPDLYLYGALMEVFNWAQDGDGSMFYENLYLKAVDQTNVNADKQRYSGALSLQRIE